MIAVTGAEPIRRLATAASAMAVSPSAEATAAPCPVRVPPSQPPAMASRPSSIWRPPGSGMVRYSIPTGVWYAFQQRVSVMDNKAQPEPRREAAGDRSIE